MSVALRRLSAFAVDWLVIALWIGILFGAVMIATNGNPRWPTNPWAAQALGFVEMTLPVTLYFALCERSAWRASIGKRVLGLAVSRETGGRLSFGSALLRNGLKFVPWEFGHTIAWQASLGDGAFPAWLWGPVAVAVIGPAWWIGAMFTTGQTPYDRWASARVTRLAGAE